MMKLEKTSIASGKAIWQNVHETAQGGFTLDTTGLTIGSTLAAGTAIVIDEATRLARPAADEDTPAGLLYEETEVAVNADVAVVTRGTIYARRAAVVSAALRAKLPLIIFSESK